MATKRDGDSCYNKAGIDEPLFVLRAQDATAPDTVEYWLSLNPHLHHTAKGYEALRLVRQMRAWQDAHLAKMAD
jgi:hypothetical protein